MEAIGYLLKTAQQSLRTALDAALRDLGVTTPQYAVLGLLEGQPGLSGAELARRAFVTPQTMNRIVANLEAAGFVERAPHPELGRVLQARLSEPGRAVLAQCRQRVDQVETRMVAELTPSERRKLADLLQRCTHALRSRPAARSSTERPLASRRT
jgi:DNA-binding MarR family transcriptional regulator